jgi:hypothetical protein
MLHVHRESLPESFLLILEDGAPGPEVPLERGLYRAALSNKSAVWVDCSLLSDLPAEAAELLLAYQYHLPSVGKELVLSHVTPPVQRRLQEMVRQDRPPRVVPSLLDIDSPIRESESE